MIDIAPQIGADSSLGSIAKIASRPDETAKERAFRLQEYAARLLPQERVAACLRTIAPTKGAVQVMHVPSEERAYYNNLVTCNRIWECPVCAMRITTQRREEISDALAAARALGWTPIMLSYTLSHHITDPLEALLDALLKAIRDFKSGREYQDIKAEYGIVGGIRTLEATYGQNGWHPHCHEILFIAPKREDGSIVPMTPAYVTGLSRWLKERWGHVVKKQGFHASYEHGLDVIEADAEIAEYVAKYGHEPQEARWTASDEIARAPVKRGNYDGLTPFQLLERYGRDGDKRAGALFVEYATVFKSRNQLVWSRGLRGMLALGIEKTEEQITEASPEAVEVAYILPDAWSVIVRCGKRGELLKIAATGDVTVLRAWFKLFGIGHVDLKEYGRPLGKPK